MSGRRKEEIATEVGGLDATKLLLITMQLVTRCTELSRVVGRIGMLVHDLSFGDGQRMHRSY